MAICERGRPNLLGKGEEYVGRRARVKGHSLSINTVGPGCNRVVFYSGFRRGAAAEDVGEGLLERIQHRLQNAAVDLDDNKLHFRIASCEIMKAWI